MKTAPLLSQLSPFRQSSPGFVFYRELLFLLPLLLVGFANSFLSVVMAQTVPAVVFPCQEMMLRMEADIRYLASPELKGRLGADAILAGRYVEARFQELGLQPAFAEGAYRQAIPGPLQADGRPSVQGYNICGILRGTDPELAEEYLLVAAHHDHLGRSERGFFAGADDNATGVAMVLEAARYFSKLKTPPARSILFASFDLEEYLLIGSRWWTAHPPVRLSQIRQVIVADMLGRSLGDLPLESFFIFGSEHGFGSREIWDSIRFPDDCRPIFLSDDFVGTRSDYAPFRDQKIPFLFLSTGQSRDYHTVRDTADKINFAQVARITQGLIEYLQQIGQPGKTLDWVENPDVLRAELEQIHKIVLLTEEHQQEWKLTPLQRLFVSRTRQETERLLKKPNLDAGDQRSLTAATQLLLLSVF